MKKTLYILALSFQTLLFAQTQKINVNTDFGHAPDCNGYQGICAFHSSNKKTNTKLSYDASKNELTITIVKDKLTEINRQKLTNNKLEDGFYLYRFDENYVLPTEIISKLNIKDKKQIKKGQYLVKETDTILTLIIQLE